MTWCVLDIYNLTTVTKGAVRLDRDTMGPQRSYIGPVTSFQHKHHAIQILQDIDEHTAAKATAQHDIRTELGHNAPHCRQQSDETPINQHEQADKMPHPVLLESAACQHAVPQPPFSQPIQNDSRCSPPPVCQCPTLSVMSQHWCYYYVRCSWPCGAFECTGAIYKHVQA